MVCFHRRCGHSRRRDSKGGRRMGDRRSRLAPLCQGQHLREDFVLDTSHASVRVPQGVLARTEGLVAQTRREALHQKAVHGGLSRLGAWHLGPGDGIGDGDGVFTAVDDSRSDAVWWGYKDESGER